MPIPSQERTASGHATWPFQDHSKYIVFRAKRLRRWRPAQLAR